MRFDRGRGFVLYSRIDVARDIRVVPADESDMPERPVQPRIGQPARISN